jgi:hypothetical protein
MDEQGGELTYASPDKEVSIILGYSFTYEDEFLSATEDRIRLLAGMEYVPQQTMIGGERCTRWAYKDGTTLSIRRLFRHSGKGYSLLFRLPEDKFSKWEATLDEVRESFRLKEFPHGK